MTQPQTLNCGIPVVDRYIKDIYSPPNDPKYPITLLKNVRLRVAAEFPDWHRKIILSQVFDEDGIAALDFHGLDRQPVDYQDRKFIEGATKMPIIDFFQVIERESSIDALLGCNLTPEDIRRNDLIYIVGNHLNVAPWNEPKEGGKLDLLIFPQFKGGGYFSIRGVKYSIPRLGEDAKVIE